MKLSFEGTLKQNHSSLSNDFCSLALENNFELTKDEIPVFERFASSLLKSCTRVDELARNLGSGTGPRKRIGHLPLRSKNPYNAWAWKCSLKLAGSQLKNQKLQGKRIVVKDNVLVAGVPLRNGSPFLKNYIPSLDATIVTRILESGGEISGKSTCENLCTSGGSHTSYPRPVMNPLDPKYMTGGSSSGSAALVAQGAVDMAIGGDQAGSIRIPSSWCGIFGLKPTFGLVPYSGVMGMESVLDHVGPMARNVEDLALLLEVIAGRDGLDPRQLNTPNNVPRYTQELRKKRLRRKLKIGLVREGFSWDKISEPDVDRSVRDFAYSSQDTRMIKVSEISIPMHRDAIHIWSCICQDGIWNNVVRNHGFEHLWAGDYDVGLVEVWSEALERYSKKLSETAKLIGLTGNYAAKMSKGRIYALAHNLRRRLIRAYDLALEEYDILLMPTTPKRAQPFPRGEKLEWMLEATLANIENTCAFDVSGHPAINVPHLERGRMPFGIMLIGKYYDEITLLEAAKDLGKEYAITSINVYSS